MAIAMYVLFSGKLPGKAALARTMRELGFPLTIGSDVGLLERYRGYMPMRLRREETGVEFDTFNDRSDVEEIAGEDFDPRFERSAGFRWGGDETEMLAGMCSAAGLAKLVDGMVLDGETGRLMTPDEAVAFARRYLEPYLARAEPPGGTRPQDLRRYLKPLLELRSDLVLVGRMLLVRPVRHLLRGAYFDRTSNKYRLRVHQFVHPLYCYQGPYAYGDFIHDASWEVWQPHFQSLLIDCLADEIFSWVGKVTTLDDFAALPFSSGWFFDTQIFTRFLMGGWDHAADYVRKVEQDGEEPSHIKLSLAEQLNELPRDVGSVCARLHAREAGTVGALKLDRVWEPSPFPVELPPGERSKAAEPFFPVDPWIPRPESLLAEAPDKPGEISYAKQWLRRDGRPILVAPLTPESAEERHKAGEEYALFVRLPDGLLLIINRNLGDRNEPNRRPSEWLHVELHGPIHYASGTFFERGASAFRLQSIDVNESSPHEDIWRCNLNINNGEKTTFPRRGKGISSRLNRAERRLAIFNAPAFGEYAGVADQFRSLLQGLGYGDLT